MADLFAQNCKLNGILTSWKHSVQSLAAQAHELEEGRKQSERRTRELRLHVESLNREFERIQGSVTPGGRLVDSDADRGGTVRKNAAETSVEDKLSIIRNQLDETERRLRAMNNNSNADGGDDGAGAIGTFVAPPIPDMNFSLDGPTSTDRAQAASPPRRSSVADTPTTAYYRTGTQASLHHCGADLPPPTQSAFRNNFDLNPFNESRNVWSQPTRQVHEHHGDAPSTWKTPPNQHNRNCLLQDSSPQPPNTPPPGVRAAITDISIKEVDPDGRFIRLVNSSAYRDDEIGCCVLQQTFDGQSIVIFRFPPRVIFPALGTVTVWAGSGSTAADGNDGPNTSFSFRELMRWGTGPGYTTTFCRPNGQAIAWTGSSPSGSVFGQGQSVDVGECGMPPVSVIKNSMASRLNNNKSACIELKKKERFQPRVLTPNGVDGKPQSGTIYPASCAKFAEFLR